MFKKVYYLASVSMLATLAMAQPGRAMEGDKDDLASNKTIQNSRYYDSKGIFSDIDPRIGTFSHISEEANRDIGEKINRIFKLKNQVSAGNYDELAGDAIEFLIASLVGEGKKTLFGSSDKDIDTTILVKASKKLVDMFFKHLSENNDSYGELSDGTHVTIYNKSLFKLLADKYFPQIPVVTDFAIAFLDNTRFKTAIQNKICATVFNYLKDSLAQQGVTLKGKLGKDALSFGKSMLFDESTVKYKELWGYLSPHLNYHLRNCMIPLLKTAKDDFIKSIESDLWYATVAPTGVVAGMMMYGAGTAVYNLASYFNDPIIAGAGYVCSSLLGVAATSIGSTFVADSYFHAAKKHISRSIDHRLSLLAHHLTPYSREEHAIFRLNNNNPSHIERGFAWDDYQYRDYLNSQGFIRNVFHGFGEVSGVNALLAYLFGVTAAPTDLVQLKYCMFEEQEQAARQLLLLDEQDPAAAAKIRRKLKKYPSFEQKIKFLEHLQTVSLDEVQREEAAAQRYMASRKAMVKKVREVAGLLSQNIPSLNPALIKELNAALVKEILASSTSIESQDYLIKMLEDQPEELVKFAQQFASEGLIHTSSLQGFDNNGDAEEQEVFVDKEKVKNFIATLTQTAVKDYTNSLNKLYLQKNKEPISYLLSQTYTAEMDPTQVAYLHGHFVRAENKAGPFDWAFPEIKVQVLSFLEDDKDLCAVSRVSRNWYKLSSDRLDDRRVKEFDLSNLSPGQVEYFKQHRHDIITIGQAYNELKVNHRAFTLREILKKHLHQTNVPQTIKQEILAKGGIVKSDLEAMTERVLTAFTVDDNYKAISPIIRPLRGDDESALYKRYKLERDILAQQIAKDILGQAQEKDVKKWLQPCQSSSSTSGWSVSAITSWGSGATPVYELKAENVNDQFAKCCITLEAHDESEKGEQAYDLLKLIRTMEFKDHSVLSVGDFIDIHQRILQEMATKAVADDRDYVTKYGQEIAIQKSKDPFFRNRLFYTYAELVQSIRARDQTFLKSLYGKR